MTAPEVLWRCPACGNESRQPPFVEVTYCPCRRRRGLGRLIGMRRGQPDPGEGSGRVEQAFAGDALGHFCARGCFPTFPPEEVTRG